MTKHKIAAIVYAKHITICAHESFGDCESSELGSRSCVASAANSNATAALLNGYSEWHYFESACTQKDLPLRDHLPTIENGNGGSFGVLSGVPWINNFLKLTYLFFQTRNS